MDSYNAIKLTYLASVSRGGWLGLSTLTTEAPKSVRDNY